MPPLRSSSVTHISLAHAFVISDLEIIPVLRRFHGAEIQIRARSGVNEELSDIMSVPTSRDRPGGKAAAWM